MMPPVVQLCLGNGDLIALAGLIVLAAKKHGSVLVPTLKENELNARTLFASVPAVKIFVVESMAHLLAMEVEEALTFFEPTIPKGINRDHYEHLYNKQGYDYSARWFSSPVWRSRARVPQVLVPAEPYALIHDDIQRRMPIKTLQPFNLKLVRLTRTKEPLLAYCDLIENAAEIHFIDSAPRHLAEHCKVKTDKLYLHRYPRAYAPIWMDYKARHPWKVIE